MAGRPSKKTPERDAQPSVYLIWADSTTIFKVGYTARPAEQRLRALQTASPLPLVLIGSKPGSRGDEVALHQKFAAFRTQGEWFWLDDDDSLFALFDEYGTTAALNAERALGVDGWRHPGWRVILWLAARHLKQRKDALTSEADA